MHFQEDAIISLEKICTPVQKQLDEIEIRFAEEFVSGEPFVEQLLSHVSRRRGKRLRPGLLLLSGRAAGALSETHILLAMAVEAIHGATLVHDDVLDEAEIRRHCPTVNNLWGNEASVLLGDFLFATAFRLATRTGHNPAQQIISATSTTVCKGELLQIGERNNFDISEERYIEIIGQKTAALYECACLLGVKCAGGDDSMQKALADYGWKIGMAFQIVDDCLDLVGDESQMGKSLGTDLAKGKFTLPLIHLMRKDPDVLGLVKKGVQDAGLVPQICDRLASAGSVEYALGVAREYTDNAKQAVSVIGSDTIRTALEQVADYVVRRDK